MMETMKLLRLVVIGLAVVASLGSSAYRPPVTHKRQNLGNHEFFISARGDDSSSKGDVIYEFNRAAILACRSIGYGRFQIREAADDVTNTATAVTVGRFSTAYQETEHNVIGYITCTMPLQPKH
jgi:hypothetical protein